MQKIVEDKTSGQYMILFNYRQNLVDQIKLIPGRRFDYIKKIWTVPLSAKQHVEQFARKNRFVMQGVQAVENTDFTIPPMPDLKISIPLKLTPYPYQQTGIAYCLEKKKTIIGDEPGLGKAQPLFSKIATPSGWKEMRDLKVGDSILGSDGKTHMIEGVYPQGVRPYYKVEFNDGTFTHCDEEHLWVVRDSNRRLRNKGWTVKATKELLERGLMYKQNVLRQSSGRKQCLKWEIPLTIPFDLKDKNFIIHPYILGVLLGDGSMCNGKVCISIPDFEIETKERIEKLLPSDLKFTKNNHPPCPQYYITQTGTTKKNPYLAEIERLNLNVKGKDKYIPEEYLFASKSQRLDLLRGLMDSDGSSKDGRITFHSCSRKLAYSISDLVFSLGGQAIIREYDRSKENKSDEYQVNIRIEECPFYLKRKSNKWRIAKRNYASKYICSIKFQGTTETQCIKVSAENRQYLTDNFIVTHNTAQAIAAITGANAFPCLVICPSSLKINWQREWHMWTDKKALILNDKNKNTWMHFAKGNNLFGSTDGLAQVFITNYESLKKFFVSKIEIPGNVPLRLNHIKFKESINLFRSVVIDESHRVKDSKTQQAKFTKGITHGKEYILALTGTPVVNKPRDLVSQLGIIDQIDKLGGFKRFIERYCEGWDGASNLQELNYLLNKHCFYRRAKSEVLKDLPAKMRQVVLCDINTRKEYNDALADLEVYLKKYRHATDEKIQSAMRGEVMVRIGILKNISARGKLNDVIEYISDIVESGEKIVVFVHLKEVAGILKKFFPASVTILGEDGMQERQKAIDSFQKDPTTQVIICSIKAAGVGITLTASSRVAFVELPWHPADSEQCEDRCIVEGEPILTPNGWVPVEQIKKGDCIINRYGDKVLVNDAWSKGNTKLVTEIQIEGWGVIKTTNDHRYLTENGWKEASSLLPGDKIVMPKPLLNPLNLYSVPFDEDCRISNSFIGNHGQEIGNGRLIKAPEPVILSDDALFCFGYFAGDGFASTMKGKGRFISLAGHITKKREALERCKRWFDSIGLNHTERQGAGNGVEIRAYSGEWAMFFEKHFGKTAHGKMLPEFIMNLSAEQSQIVLNGLMSSDGYYRKGRYEYITASLKLASQVARLILRSGFRPTVNKNTTGQYVIAYAESQKDNLSLVQSVFTYFPKKINGVRPKVYDLTTDNTESFVVGLSVVHNCHRIGQKDSVQCTYFLGKDTIDEWIYKVIDEKRKVAHAITGATNDVEESVMDSVINLFTQKL